MFSLAVSPLSCSLCNYIWGVVVLQQWMQEETLPCWEEKVIEENQGTTQKQ